MIKWLKAFAIAALLALQTSPVAAWPRHGSPSAVATANSQFNPNFWAAYTLEFPSVNLFKTADQWSYAAGGTGVPQPDELTSDGYPIAGKGWFTIGGGAVSLIPAPIQAENAGDYVVLWLGQSQLGMAYSGATSTGVSCTGTASNPFGSARCDNSSCSTMTASIAPGLGTDGVMTVTAAPTGSGCTLAVGTPVSGQVSQFDTVTVVVGNSTTNSNRCSPACTGTGTSTGTYAVNISQTQSSGTMTLGGRLRLSTPNTVGFAANALLTQLRLSIITTGTGTGQVRNIAVFNVNEESAYWSSHIPCGNGKACIVSPIFKQRAQQANFATLRDLNWNYGNTANCSTWSSRKPVSYYTYAGSEFRNAASGNETYTVQGQTYTIPKIGQYVNASGGGASGGTISANVVPRATTSGWISGTVYHVTSISSGAIVNGNGLSGSGVTTDTWITSQATTSGGDVATYNINNSQTVFSSGSPGTITANETDYNITLGSGNFIDKQTILARFASGGDFTTKISLNGNTLVPLLGPSGGNLRGSGFDAPFTGETATIFYDATLNGLLFFSNRNPKQVRGLDCGPPPEVVMEIAAELGETLWHVPPFPALDPATDWVKSHATYQLANYTGKPTYEVSNEPFNCVQINAVYMSAKSSAYNAIDPTAWPAGFFYCGANTGNTYGWIGKVTSTMGQDLVSVYGAGNFELSSPVQTSYPPGSQLYNALTSVNYVNQTLIPAQTGYTKTAGYLYATRVSNSNYWNPGFACGENSTNNPCDVGSNAYRGLEAGLAYCYYNFSISSACQSAYASQAAIMTVYMNSSIGTSCGAGTCQSANITSVLSFNNQWSTQAKVCFTGGARPGSCTVNATNPLAMYEGTFAQSKLSGSLTNTFTSAGAPAANAVLNIPSNGCVAGETVALSGLSGGTWSGAAGSYTVQASGTDANHCAVNLNSTGLGTLTAATLTYTSSTTYVNALRQASYLSPDLDTLTTTLYNGILANGGYRPSMFNLTDNGALFNSPWLAFGPSLYSGIQIGICTSCSIASTTLTLGGVAAGSMFRTGDVLYGTSVTGPGFGSGVQTILGACTPIGANVCGTTAGDTFALNQASTASGAMTTVAPTYTNTLATYNCSPVRQWSAILKFNGNTTCN